MKGRYLPATGRLENNYLIQKTGVYPKERPYEGCSGLILVRRAPVILSAMVLGVVKLTRTIKQLAHINSVGSGHQSTRDGYPSVHL